MKTRTPLFRIDRLLIAALTSLAMFATSQHLGAQVTLSGTNYFQNFNSLGSGLPTGWTTRTNVSSTSLGSSLAFANTNPTAAVNAWSNTTAGFKNFASATGLTNTNTAAQQGAATNRALGIKPTAAFGDTSTNFVSFAFQLNNTLGFNNFSLSMDAMMVAAEGRTNVWTLDYGIGASPTSFTTLTNWTTPTTFGTTTLAISSDSLTSIANLSDNVWFRFSLLSTSTGSGSRDSVAIDNFSLTYSAIAAALNWAGGSGNWSDGFGGTVTNGSALSFSGSGGIATNNLVAPLIASMTFSNGAGSYTVAGDAFTISNGIVNNSANAQTFSNAITLGAAQTFNAASGGMTFAGNITNGGFRLTVDGASNTVVSGAVSGSGGLTKSGAGTATLSGANTYSGGTLISAGALRGDSTSLQGLITNNSAIIFDQSADGAYTNVLSGSGTFTKFGAATLTLSGANTFTNALAISNGAVRLANNTASGTAAGGITVASGAALELSNGITVGAEALSLSGAGVGGAGALLSVSGNNTYGGAITNTGAVTIAADSGSTMTISGGVNLNSGTMTVGGGGNTLLSGAVTNGSVTKAGNGTVTFSNTATSFSTLTTGTGETAFATNATITGLAGAGAVNLVGGTLTVSNTTAQSFSGAISGAGGLTKRGSATLTVSGSNTYGGATLIAAGGLTVGASNTLPTGTAVTVGTSGATANGGRFNIGDGLSQTIGSLTLLGGNTSDVNSGQVLIGAGSTLVLGGNITYETGALNRFRSYISGGTLDLGGVTRTVAVNSNNNTADLEIDSVIANGSLTKAGTGILQLDSANTLGGTVLITAGELALYNTNALQNATLDVGTSGAQLVSFNTNGAFTYNIGALAGADALAISNNTLSIGGNNSNSSMTGAITGTGGSITKIGLGTLTLQSTTSAYSGTTRVSAGTLRVQTSANSLGTSTVDMAGGNLELAANTGQTFGRNTIVSSNSTITIDRTAAGASVNHTMGTLSIGSQTLNVDKGSSIDAGSTGGLIFGAATLTASGATFNTASETALTLASVGGSGFSFTVAGSGNTTVSGAIATGAGSVTKTGLGTLTLSGANTYNGGTLVSAGALSGSTTSLVGSITNNGTVIFSQSTNGSYDGVMSGVGGALVKSGTGTVTTTGVNTFTGPTTVTAGRLLVNGTNASSAVTMATNASLGGSGRVGDLTVSGLLAPGNSVGTLSAGSTIFNTNGAFELEIFDFSGAAGSSWDLLAITGDLTLSNTDVNPFIINLVSLTNSTTPGFANFNPNLNYTNTFVTFTGDLLGSTFNTNLFSISTTSFSNAITLNGAFSVTNVSGGLALLYSTFFVPASDYTWTAGSGLWSDQASWTNNIEPGEDGAIVFAGAGGNSTNDLVNSTASLNFSNTAGSYTVSGNAITNGVLGVVNNSANAQTINNNITLGGAQTFDAAAGDLNFGGDIDNAGFLLSVSGASNVVINGAVSNTGGINMAGTGSLTLGGNNTFSGTLAANAGTVVVNGTQATAAVNVAGGTLLLGAAHRLNDNTTLTVSSGTLDFGGFSDTILTFNLNGGVFTNGTIGGMSLNLNGGTMGGTINGGSTAVGGSVSLSGSLSSLVNINSGGTLTLAANDRIGNSSSVIVNAGTLATATFTDTVGSLLLTNGGSLTGSGTITAATYTLNGGTVGANLGAGTATAAAGTTALNGTLDGDLAVSGGTVNLGSGDRIGGASAVTVSSGTLGISTFNDTVGSFTITGGTLGGTTGTLTAGTYALQGGTLSANLGAGTATVTTGTTALNGTLGAATVNINSGTLNLGSANRLSDSAAVTLNGGTLGISTLTDTVGSFTIAGGTLGGTSGTLTASTYALNGGTLTANLGTGTATASSGTTALNGTLAATTLSINGGTVNLGSANRLADTAAITLSSGTLGMSTFNDTVGSFVLSGGTLGGTTGTLTAATYDLQSGTINARLGAGAVTVSNGTTTLGSTGRLNSASTLAVNGGQLTLGGAETVSTYTQTGGTLGGVGQTLTAASYALQGGTVTANLGSGTATVSSGTTAINGNLGGALTASGGTANVNGTVAGNVNVSGGTVNLGSADRISATSAVAVSSGALNLNGNDSVASVQITGGSIAGSGVLTATSNYDVQAGTISAAIGGSAAMTKSGANTATLSGDNSAYSGPITVGSGTLLAAHNNAFGSGAVSVTNGSVVAGDGRTIANNFTIGSAGGLQVFYSENFNSIGTSSTASLPTGWKMSAAGAGTTSTFWTNTANLSAVTQAASSGTPASGGAYNWGFSADTNNRSIGFMSSGSYAEPNSIMFAFTNTTGQTITNFTVSFDYLRFRTNTTAISNVFYFSDSSSSWGGAINTNTWSTGTSGYNFGPSPVSLTNTIALTITNGGVGYLMWTFDATGNGNSQGLGLDNFVINTQGGPSGSGTLGINEAGTATFSGNIVNNNAATFTAASGGTATFSGAISGAGSLTKTGLGTVTLSGASANTFAGTTTVSAGTLQLNKSTGITALASTNIIVSKVDDNNRAVLLLSASGQVADSTAVTLSGGTITRGSGVSEVFGNLNLTEASILDFGTGAVGELQFGTYTSSALLTVNNFLPGNKLIFVGTDLSGSINNPSLFSFQGDFQSAWNSGNNTFTITAIPEPSTYLAAAGLLGVMLWPSRKRIIKDAKKILGLRAPMRDRLAARRA